MDSQKPTSKEFEIYQKVNAYLKPSIDKVVKNEENRFSIFPKPTWVWVILLAVIACLSWYGLTTLLFGEEFWVRSVLGTNPH